MLCPTRELNPRPLVRQSDSRPFDQRGSFCTVHRLHGYRGGRLSCNVSEFDFGHGITVYIVIPGLGVMYMKLYFCKRIHDTREKHRGGALIFPLWKRLTFKRLILTKNGFGNLYVFFKDISIDTHH
ncbi:hypothetical protein SFRURICE_007334, partial [Spodoptera frugiperda]